MDSYYILCPAPPSSGQQAYGRTSCGNTIWLTAADRHGAAICPACGYEPTTEEIEEEVRP